MKRILVAALLAVVPMLAHSESVTLSLDECLSIAPAAVQALESLQQSPAVSQKAQKVVEWLVRDASEYLSQFKSGDERNEARGYLIENLPTQVSLQCLQVAMSNNGEVPIELPDNQ